MIKENVYVDSKLHHTNDNESLAYEILAKALISKKLCQCKYITRIVRKQHYTHVTIDIYYDNGVRCEYILED